MIFWEKDMKKISIPSRLWYENKEWELTLPDRWEVDNLSPTGFDKPKLPPKKLEKKLITPSKDLL